MHVKGSNDCTGHAGRHHRRTSRFLLHLTSFNKLNPSAPYSPSSFELPRVSTGEVRQVYCYCFAPRHDLVGSPSQATSSSPSSAQRPTLALRRLSLISHRAQQASRHRF
ncbi:hypothetical protein CBOM_07546 [Ceraceosorus bombacis]|uniref:Uncharacterized protein n=1 Tax=Ceraceosorus bombacis TaxID=401625 RepID=A0A0P1BF20_9BASI|nr:hypothetical protein CBOM_07546 [Ceraceosorus bombacis]